MLSKKNDLVARVAGVLVRVVVGAVLLAVDDDRQARAGKYRPAASFLPPRAAITRRLISSRVGVGPSYSWSFSEGWSRLKAEVEVSNDRVMIRMASAQL